MEGTPGVVFSLFLWLICVAKWLDQLQYRFFFGEPGKSKVKAADEKWHDILIKNNNMKEN